ncbi:MAG: ATP-dependent RecD-like DNA helicase [Acholeplasmataceae bacterium]
MSKVIGKIKNYVFHNEDNSYSIARLLTEDEDIVTIVGYFPKISEDVIYEFEGGWTKHPQYGEQLKVESFKKAEKQSKSGLISYLSSSFFTGIGPKTAEKIVELLGEQAITKIIEDPSVLKKVKLSSVRIAKFHQQLQENQTNEHILVTLYGYDLSARLAMKLLNKYHMLTIEKLEENPYRLIDDIDGIGFIKADEIAQKLGIAKSDLRRIKAAISYALEHIAYQNGDLYLTFDQLKKQTDSILGLEFDIEEAIKALLEEKRIVIEDERYYLALSYYTEIKLAEKITELNITQDQFIDQTYIKTLIDAVEIKKNITYTKVQKEAILNALTHKVSIITGGPGTGKTTIIDGLLEVYRIYHKLDFKDPSIYEKIACLAPTGRAAKRMKELLNIQTSTIHRHLGYNYEGIFAYDETHLLPQDLIIIDESSMIDLFLASRLFEAIKNDAQVIIVGDVDQLPSVGPGQILSDLIESKKIEVVKLDEIHRQAKDSNIISLARAVNIQQLTYDDLESGNDVYLYHAQQQKIQATIVKQIQGALQKGYSIVDDIQVLAPMYKGELGIDRFNEILQDHFNKDKKHKLIYKDKVFYEGDKVIQLVNDPKRLIMNGDIGVIKSITTNEEKETFVIVTFDDNDVLYEKQDLDEINLAYAISIHKSQGSEYKIVMIPMVKSYMHMLKKELIYTAITRAKQYLIILGDMKLLIYAANHLSNKRQTTLALRLNEDVEILKHEDDDLSPYDFM